MILESLVKYYEALTEKGELSKPGWSKVDVGYALDIDINGGLKRIVSLKTQEGKKLVPRKMLLPTPVKRSSGISPNFLCDNSSYFLGIDNKGKPEQSKEKSKEHSKERARECFLAAKEYHCKMLPQGEDVTTAIMNFFEKWDVSNANKCEVLSEFKTDILKGGNLIFLFNGKYVHEYESVREKWINSFQIKGDRNILCGITGKRDSLAILHPSIKKIRNAQSSGASLVSYNAAAFSSFGKEQGENAQTGEYAAFAYGEALNYLTEKLTYKNYIGDTALLFYAINAEPIYQSFFSACFLGEDEHYSKEELRSAIEDICQGKPVNLDEQKIDPDMEFFLLGIAPNNARLSVRFFERGSFGKFVNNIKEHQERLMIENERGTEEYYLSTWQLLQETCRSGADVSPILSGELTRAIIENFRYPATLINSIDLRIRADHKVEKRRAAIIKAYYLKNENDQIPREVLTVGLNKETENVPYNLGRLFAVLERIQGAANPGLNATIKDKYFGGASSTPATIFPKLIELSQKHLRKLSTPQKIYYERLLGEILDKFEYGFPKILSMPERGALQLGYYHQVQELFKSKKEEEN